MPFLNNLYQSWQVIQQFQVMLRLGKFFLIRLLKNIELKIIKTEKGRHSNQLHRNTH